MAGMKFSAGFALLAAAAISQMPIASTAIAHGPDSPATIVAQPAPDPDASANGVSSALPRSERIVPASLRDPVASHDTRGVTNVTELSSRPATMPHIADAPTKSIPGLQVTTAEPFSISTAGSGKPYYLGSTPPAVEYHIPHIPQEEPLWCWAAAAQQAIGWVNNGRAPAQCAIVALAHGLDVRKCCADREGICARTGEIPAIARLVNRFGGQAMELSTVPRDPKKIYEMLRNGDTLLIRLRPAPHDEAVGIRHMIVVRGIEWLRMPNNQLQATLLYNDPLGEGERAVNFDEIEGFFEQALLVRRAG